MTSGPHQPGLRGWFSYLEFAFVALIAFSLYKATSFLFSAGYLPPPFFDQSFDSFMDWYNTVYWGLQPGTYSNWGSVYPPFAFIFMSLFSLPACYGLDAVNARECDPIGVYALIALTILNAILIFLDYRKSDRRTSLTRAIALGGGLPALFALERGNVIVACFTFFILAHGHTLRTAWLRWLSFAFVVNLKPYLVVSIIGRLMRRRWRWVEGCAIASVLVYAVSFIILGKGSPIELLNNILVFSGLPEHLSLDYVEYSTTFSNILDLFKSQIPLTIYLGSKPIEMAETYLPLAMAVGTIGVLACFGLTLVRPGAVASRRLTALAVALFLTTSKGAGGYAELFLIYLVFFERADKLSLGLVLAAAYVLCVPWDFMLVRVLHAVTDSYLTGRTVGFDFGVTLGALVRPALILLIEYGLIAATLGDLLRKPSAQPAGEETMNNDWAHSAAARPA